MSATGLDVFDTTLQITNTWLAEITAEMGGERGAAWRALGAVLRTVRGRVPLDLAAGLGAQLPLLVRGAYYDRWHPAGQPEAYRTLDPFLDQVRHDLEPLEAVDPEAAARAVFEVLNRHLDHGQVDKIRTALPEPVRALWPLANAKVA